MPPHIPVRDLWWIAAGGAGYGARYLSLRLRLARSVRATEYDPTGELLRLQTLYGYNEHSLVSIAPGASLWPSPESDGGIVYGKFGKVWLAAGDPLASAEDTTEMAREFVADARRHKKIAAFIPATERFARLAAPAGLSALKIGAAPYFDLKTWNPRGDRAKKMRAGFNQSRRAGVVVEALEMAEDALKRETLKLCESWLGTRRAATSLDWLFALDPFRHAAHKKFFTARDAEGRLVGCSPPVRSPHATAGTLKMFCVCPTRLRARRTCSSLKRSSGCAPKGRASRLSAHRLWPKMG